jgi:hypothetical protein
MHGTMLFRGIDYVYACSGFFPKELLSSDVFPHSIANGDRLARGVGDVSGGNEARIGISLFRHTGKGGSRIKFIDLTYLN